MTLSQTDVMIANLLETLNQVRGILSQPVSLSPDANEAVFADALARIEHVYQFSSVQRWLATGSAEEP